MRKLRQSGRSGAPGRSANGRPGVWEIRVVVGLTPGDVRAAICRWQADGVPVPTVSARWLVLRSALSWAVGEGLLRSNPLAAMRGPARPEPRRHHTIGEVRQLLRTAEVNVERTAAARAAEPDSPGCRRLLFSAEHGRLLVRLGPTPGPGAARWRFCASVISKVGGSRSSAVCLRAYSDPPSLPAPAGSPSRRRRRR
jgi:hypothetical protein